jgi:Electron transfer DM13
VKEYLQEHRRILSIVAVFLVAAAIFVLVWFQPQKLFIEQTVDEAAPGVTEGNGASADDPSTSRASMLLASGMFQSLEHETTGTAKVVELQDGRRFLRFEDLATSNGPDLRVYLSEIPASDDWYAYGERFVDLGALKGNQGSQNYEIPPDADLSRYKSAVVWCRRFTVGFGVAPLT